MALKKYLVTWQDSPTAPEETREMFAYSENDIEGKLKFRDELTHNQLIIINIKEL